MPEVLASIEGSQQPYIGTGPNQLQVSRNGESSPGPSIATSNSSISSNAPSFKYLVMIEHLFQKQLQSGYLRAPDSSKEGVFLKVSSDDYVCLPSCHQQNTALAQSVRSLSVPSLMTVSCPAISRFLENNPDAVDIPLSDDIRVQILSTYNDLPRAKRHQYAAFIMEEKLLVVWDDDALHLQIRASDILTKMTMMVWKQDQAAETDEDEDFALEEIENDPETGELPVRNRKTKLLNSILVALTLILIVLVLGAGARQLAIECAVDRQMARLGLLFLAPVQVFFTLFFAQVIVGCIAQTIGPTQQMKTNSRFYSAVRSPRIKNVDLPHVTIQCPVYKESLESVIAPTVRSIKQAISTYELQGGSANIFINDDGLQGISEEDRNARIQFYADNQIGWTARPNHNSTLLDGTKFVKKGKFKKASNMNYGLMMSCRVEELLSQVQRHANWAQDDEDSAYISALQMVITERPDAWASGNIRIGDYILLVDSDTRIPSHVFLDAVSELAQSPSVSILQFTSSVLQIQHDYFENGITFFTNLIYSAIRYTVANGDVAPFVGHNAFLRWSAIQQVAYLDEDNYPKFWSESHVSEDFDMALRLQCEGYIIRLASWAGDGFKEGVSLTVYDELARWEKYAYGCNELLFHPLRYWYKGPFTPLFKRFLFSNIRFTSKITIISYIGTYYAIGAAWIMTLANYFLIGWYNGYLDKYYIDSWKVWFSLVVVFNGLGNVGLAAMRYRDEDFMNPNKTGKNSSSKSSKQKIKGFFGHLLTNLTYTPLLLLFLGGLSLHISSALLSHLLSIPISWGATAKESQRTHFFLEAPKILRKFKWSMIFGFAGIGLMAVMANLGRGWVGKWGEETGWMWEIRGLVAVLPLGMVLGSHILMPVVLNPGLMVFSY